MVVPGSAIELVVSLQPEHARDIDRFTRAAATILEAFGDWIGPLPYDRLTIVDPGWRSSPDRDPGAVMLDRTPWWNARASFAPELATARGLSRRVWHDAIGNGTLPSWLVEGFAEYAARRVVVPLFQKENNPPGFAFLEERYFGGFVPHFVRIRLRPEADGDPIPAYRAHPAAPMTATPLSSRDARSLTAKTVLALGTLERWVGRPVFDEALAVFVRLSRDHTPTLVDFERVTSEVAGQDLSWFFDQAFRTSASFDYGVERLASERQAEGGYLTTIVARRYGDATFSGRSASREGPFESGRGVLLRVAFADGTAVTDHWDGRDRDKTFTYQSLTAAISAEIDPEQTILLDVRRANNSVTREGRGDTAAVRWAARYVNWVANALLQYAVLV
ncbi:MAG: hypothetical protein ABJA98_29905 [Acidobacteriota bacterium]